MTKNELIKIIQNGEIAYQIADGLLSFSSIDLDPLIDILKETNSFSFVHRDDMLDSRYSELAQWAIESDYLFLSDNGVLICLTENMIENNKSVA